MKTLLLALALTVTTAAQTAKIHTRCIAGFHAVYSPEWHCEPNKKSYTLTIPDNWVMELRKPSPADVLATAIASVKAASKDGKQ